MLSHNSTYNSISIVNTSLCSKMWSTYHPLLRSSLWWKLSKGEGEKNTNTGIKYKCTFHLSALNSKAPHRFFSSAVLIKSWRANTSRDSFKFCQVLGKSGQARFLQHDLLQKGMEQGEILVPPTQLGKLEIKKKQTEGWKTYRLTKGFYSFFVSVIICLLYFLVCIYSVLKNIGTSHCIYKHLKANIWLDGNLVL